ncbi:MAG: response regulator [Fimbriimonadaceae bacterium]|nr:response regulator [Fimbriimonadaceae bacterium]
MSERWQPDLIRFERDLALAVAAAPDLATALERLIDGLLTLLPVDAAGVYLFDPSGRLDLAAARNLPASFLAAVEHLAAEDPRTVLVQAGETVYEPARIPVPDQDGKGALHVLAVLPVRDRDTVIGSVNLASHSAEVLPTELRPTLEAVVANFGPVLARARAQDELQAQGNLMQAALRGARAVYWQRHVPSGESVADLELLSELLGNPPWERGAAMNAWFAQAHPADRERMQGGMEALLRGESARWDEEFRVQAADGQWRWFSGHGTVIERDHSGAPVRIAGTSMDITDVKTAAIERQRLTEHYQQVARLEAVAHVAGGIAHEFNNLLTAMSGYLDLVNETLDPDDPRRRDLAQAQQAARRAGELTEHLLTFSRRAVTTPEPLQASRVVQQVVRLLRPVVGHQLQIKRNLDPGAGEILADRAQIEQIVLNLLLNARDALPDGGNVTITTAAHPVTRSPAGTDLEPGDYLLLTVSDDGCGIEPAHQRRVFEPFFTTKSPTEHAGLGLATVYGIVERLGGVVQIESALGQGTTVRIWLPCCPADAPAEEPSRPLRVLVVDDDDAVRRLTRRMLAAQGFEVLDAPNAEAALGLVEERPAGIDVLVTDVVMPGRSGDELAAMVRELVPAVKVLFISGHPGTGPLRREVTVDGVFLQKPFDSRLLAAAVRQACQR